MPDPRFFEDLGPVTLAELAGLTGAELSDADQGQRQVRGVAVLASAQADTVTFLTDKKYADGLYRGFYTPGQPRRVMLTFKALF